MDLTIAEIELLRMFDTSSRRRLISGLIGAAMDLDDKLFETAVSALEKLSCISDADFRLLKINNNNTEMEV